MQTDDNARPRRADAAHEQRVRQQVEEKWQQARQEKTNNVMPGRLVPYYDEALQIAQTAADTYPESAELQVLLAQARQAREDASSVEEIATEPAALGEFNRAMEYVKNVHDDELVPSFNDVGEFLGYFPKQQALQMLQGQAREYSGGKLRVLARRLETFADQSAALDKALEVVVQTLRVSGLGGKIGNAQLQSYVSTIQPDIRRLVTLYGEIAAEIRADTQRLNDDAQQLDDAPGTE